MRDDTAVWGRAVLLVDDVVTTGATVNSCTDELLDGGASEVIVAALASPYFGERYVQMLWMGSERILHGYAAFRISPSTNLTPSNTR
jgi:hypoxanthine-guanine phosphoribosyltransferase